MGQNKSDRYRKIAERFEAQMMAVCRQQFEHQRVQILANLDVTRIGTKGYKRKDWLDDLIDWVESTATFKSALQPIVHAVLVDAGQSAMQEVGKQPSLYDPFTPAIRDYFQARSLKIASDVNDETQKQIRASLSQGVQNGESPAELQGRVEDVMGSASSMRADRIARTETTRAQGFGDLEAWKQSGVVDAKEWFTAEDEHVCPFCDDLDGKTIGLDDNFFDKGDSNTVGDQSQSYSYDDVPSAPLHVNCRCVLLPVRG